MVDSIRLLALKVVPKEEYPNNTFFVFKIPALTLANIAYVPVRLPIIRKGTQRPTDRRRLREIAQYISRKDAMFPNTIIVNFVSDVKVTKLEEFSDLFWLDIPMSENSAVILDGQHRLLGIEESNIDINILITAFLGVSHDKEAAIFRDINFYQRKVNKSLMYDLFHVAKDAGYPLMRALDLTERLNEDGPLSGLIKLTGIGPGVVTQTIFVETLQSFLEDGSIFRETEYNQEDSLERQTEVIKDYFESLRGHYRNAWEFPRDYILLKTQGIYALLMLLQNILYYFLNEKNRCIPKVRDFEAFTVRLSNAVSFSSEDYGDAYLGSGGQKRLHRLIYDVAFQK